MSKEHSFQFSTLAVIDNKNNNDNLIDSDHAPLEDSKGIFQIIMRFSPLLLIYIFIVLMSSSNTFQGDEGRYVMYATNLSNGYYSPQNDVYLWNGPGYPIVLLPFVILKLPWMAAKLLNPVFLFAAVIYFYNTLRFYILERPAFFFSYLLGLYPPFCRYIYLLLTETFIVFLICGFVYHLCKLIQKEKVSSAQLLVAAFYLGFIALSKIFYGYVILSGIFLFLSLYMWRKRDVFKRTLLVYLLALFVCVPYLIYTFSITGKIFYWGNSGGQSLYWMSTPYENELGDWQSGEQVFSDLRMIKNHSKFYSETEGLSNVQIDEAFKKRAIQNIKLNPSKYFHNWLANVGRLLFNYPYSYSTHRLSTYFYIIPNSFLVVMSILCVYPTYVGRNLIPDEIYVLGVFGFFAFAGSSFVSAYSRQLNPLVPLLALWIILILFSIVKVEAKR